ncbi:DUF1127 domain-containing protein [Rhodalgimonas zhirmunskyi]|uniref:DUF1127 domain-containing protein n=1 Tax=Rhodalgimonas zhirmunskyi TaxID=2964767 RepID=A0AAJ1U8G9_9RHOB|nr:DUF1127 domain-containing protein [Rhodoalgimonas zhirmunskyi]MDQ2093720.1 DUF1127 domain-containing protein [Rhodoalgimonas zhirmunskyi]
MAVIETSRTRATGTGRIGQGFAALFATVAAWNDARVTRNALGKLSDRELEDIGLCRGDIDAIAAHR